MENLTREVVGPILNLPIRARPVRAHPAGQVSNLPRFYCVVFIESTSLLRCPCWRKDQSVQALVLLALNIGPNRLMSRNTTTLVNTTV